MSLSGWAQGWLGCFPDSNVHRANMGPIWGRQAQVGPMLAPWTLLSGFCLACLHDMDMTVTKIWDFVRTFMFFSGPYFCVVLHHHQINKCITSEVHYDTYKLYKNFFEFWKNDDFALKIGKFLIFSESFFIKYQFSCFLSIVVEICEKS